MRSILTMVLLLTTLASAHAAVNLAISQQSGADVQKRANELAGQLGTGIGTSVNVVVLPDANQVEAWLNRYATAELALVEAGFVASRPGQFVIIKSVGRDLTLIGRQGIAGDLPQRIAAVLEGQEGRSSREVAAVAPPKSGGPSVRPAVPPRGEPLSSVPSKSIEEDRYFVIHVYREKFGRDPEPERLNYWTQLIGSGVVTKQQFYEQVCHQGAVLCNVEQ